MKRFAICISIGLLTLFSCKKKSELPRDLSAHRAIFQIKYLFENPDGESPPEPPGELFELIKFPVELGSNSAYITPANDEKKRPAIVWIHGGLYFGISELAWEEHPRENDQTAAAFREAGMVLMLPSLRGTNDSPGPSECFLGEVDDIIAAARYLKTRPDVDPDRVYLGGHSTGGTMALLTAVSTDEFRAVFAFGPVGSVAHYGEEGCLPTNADDTEVGMRAPLLFLREVTSPTFIIEGGLENGFDIPKEIVREAPVHVVIGQGFDHFSILRPGSEAIARNIIAGRDSISESDIQK